MNNWKLCYSTTLIALASLIVALWPGAESLFEFNRSALATGQWWRVLTGQLTHFGLEHLVWDVGVFVVLGVLCEQRDRKATLACLGIGTLFIPAAVWLALPQLETYRGLSGLDTALFAMLGCMMLIDKVREGNKPWAVTISLLLTGMVAKIVWEFATGATMFVDSSSGQFAPVPLAHLVGAVIGLLVAASTRILKTNGTDRRVSCESNFDTISRAVA